MKDKPAIIVIVIAVSIFGVMLTGWVKNLSKLTDCDFEAPYKCEVVRTVGVVPPIGAVIGYMEFDGK